MSQSHCPNPWFPQPQPQGTVKFSLGADVWAPQRVPKGGGSFDPRPGVMVPLITPTGWLQVMSSSYLLDWVSKEVQMDPGAEALGPFG